MLRKPPYRIFGIQLWACHGLPAMVAALVFSICTVAIWEAASHYKSPVVLTGLWADPRIITVDQVLAQTKGHGALHLFKNGYWSRACPTTAYQSFVDEQGVLTVNTIPHKVAVPKTLGEFDDKARPNGIFIPTELALRVRATGKPATYRFRIENKSKCPFTLFPITNAPAEATFEIVP